MIQSKVWVLILCHVILFYRSIELSLNVSLNLLNSVTKIVAITVKGFEPATSCVRDKDASTAPARHVWQTETLNWPWFMFQWFIRLLEFSHFSFHLGKTSINFGGKFLVDTLKSDLFQFSHDYTADIKCLHSGQQKVSKNCYLQWG